MNERQEICGVKNRQIKHCEQLEVFPGIEIEFDSYAGDSVQIRHEAFDYVLEINHCREGRIGWEMKSGEAVYLGKGDICIHSMDVCSVSNLTLPLKAYEGLTIYIDLKALEKSCPDILKEAGFDAKDIYRKFCVGGNTVAVPANSRIDTALTPLYDVSEEMFVPYCKLKTQEVLMFLVDMEPDKEENLTRCVSAQAEQVKQIHDFLVENADKRFTIEELSRKYLINTSSLKSVFKMIYGMPVAAYMKDYRMKKAMKMLRETDDSVAEIAERVGYGTQGKFTKAFKESLKALPTEYRKIYRKQ